MPVCFFCRSEQFCSDVPVGNHPLNETSERERVQSCNGSGVAKLAFCQGRHDAELRMRIKPLAPASVAACAPHLKGQNPCEFHQFFWASRGLVSYKE
jgi:hypothetical protein